MVQHIWEVVLQNENMAHLGWSNLPGMTKGVVTLYNKGICILIHSVLDSFIIVRWVLTKKAVRQSIYKYSKTGGLPT